MRTGLIALLLLSSLGPARAGAQEPPGPEHEYVLTAELDPEAHTVRGTARITWHNAAVVEAREIYIHLYLNAFADGETVFMRESAGALRGVAAEGEGGIEIEALRLPDGTDLLVGSDDELVAGDRTQLRVPLPAPVAPGRHLEVVAEFVATLPPVFARSGWAGSFHMVGQWFPKVARRERDGTWRTFPYHGMGEFYADFARYDLTVTAPSAFVVGATGQRGDEVTRDGKTTHHFVAERVHDVAFCAWDHFVERGLEVDGVRVRVLAPPGYDDAVDNHVATLRDGLRHFGALFGDYPYPYLTMVVPPRGAEGAAGMEYPTLFLTAGPWFAPRGVFLFGEDVTAHELGHQWFHGLIATDEVRWPMLDEGITQWVTGELLRHRHGSRRSALDVFGARLDFFQLMRIFAFRAGSRDTIAPGRPAHAFAASDYGRSVYARTSVVLETVGRTWGPRRLKRALGRYARNHRFGHPGPDDLFAAFDRELWPGFSERVLRPALMDGEDAAVRLASLRTRTDGDEFVAEIDARRTGRIALPTWVALTDEAGARHRLRWPAGEARLRAIHRGPQRIVSARVDPDRHNLLDPSIADNERRTTRAPSTGAWTRLLFLLQQLLSAVGP